jgi:eukaryotic-like serine/threonine-protein kinase
MSIPAAQGATTPDPSPGPPERTRTALLVYKGSEVPSEADPQPPAAPAPESERRQIGDFLVHRLIGEGGMGKVYEAEERLSKRKVALKVLRSELARSEAGRRAFVNEMAILARLDDPHIVRCLHCTEADGELVMALEHLDGETLREHLVREGPLAWDLVAAIAWQIAAALAAAHGAEPAIIHRDLKPENVMLVASPGQPVRVKVMDFGIAKVMQAVAGNTTHSVGTLQYMSPEQIDARPLSPRSDLYALGLVMWELLAGRPPFEAESPRVLLDKLCTEPAPTLPAEARRGLPRGLEQLVHQLLEKHPDERPADAGEVMARLDPLRPAELSLVGREPARSPASSSSGSQASASASSGVARIEPSPAATVEPTPAPTPKPSARRLDTVAVLDRASAPRELSTKLAATIIVSTSLAAGLITWLIRLLG